MTRQHKSVAARALLGVTLSSGLLSMAGCQPAPEETTERNFDDKPFELPPQGQLTPLFGKGENAKVVVSLTFDDGFASQRTFFDILEEHHIEGMYGTFYLNTSRLNLEINERESRDHVRFGGLDMWFDAALKGHEIGAHTVTHVDLSCNQERFDAGECQPGHDPLTDEERRRQICGDREMWLALGFDVKGFAYPFGRHQYVPGSSEIHDIVSSCGFSYARTVNGLSRGAYSEYAHVYPLAETVPPEDNFAIRSYQSLTVGLTFEDVKSWIMDAYDAGGGWVPLIMHQISDTCTDPEDADNELGVCTRTRELTKLVQWLDRSGEFEGNGAPSGIHVRTIGQVMTEVGNLVTLQVANGDLEEPHSGSIIRPNCFDRFEGKHETNFAWGEEAVGKATQQGDAESDSASAAPANHVEKLIPTDAYPTPLIQMTTRDDRCYLGVSAGGRYQLRVRARTKTGRVAQGRFVVKLLHLKHADSGVDPVWENWSFEDQPIHEIEEQWTTAHLNLPPIPAGAVAMAFGFQHQGPSESGAEIWLDDFTLRQYVSE